MDSMDEDKYQVDNTSPVQGQNIGDNQQITQYFAASSSSQLEQRDRAIRELKAQRKQICLPLLYSIHELAPVRAEFRKAHDDLWARQQLFFQAHGYLKRINLIFQTANQRAAVAGSELSIEPDGQKVMDAFVAYLKAQEDYFQAMSKPMSKFPTWHFNKADITTLDELEKKANDKLSALEEEIRIFVNLPPPG